MAFRYTYSFEVKHTELGKYRIVSGTDEAVVRAKAQALLDTWNAEYRRKLEKERFKADQEASRQKMRQQKENAKEQLENNLRAAEELTDEAKAALEQIANTLHSALSVNHAVNWAKLKRRDSYSTPKPKEPIYLEFPREPQPSDSRHTPPPENPIFAEYPPEPQPTDAKYQPALKLLDKLSGRDEKKVRAAYESYLQDHANWDNSVKEIEAENQRRPEAASQNDLENQRRAKLLYNEEHDAWVMACQQVQLKNETLYSKTVAAIEAWNDAAEQHSKKRDQENAAIDTLMNGANLLYLLEKHGRKAKIDIREAKKILGEKVDDV